MKKKISDARTPPDVALNHTNHCHQPSFRDISWIPDKPILISSLVKILIRFPCRGLTTLNNLSAIACLGEQQPNRQSFCRDRKSMPCYKDSGLEPNSLSLTSELLRKFF